MIYERHPCSNFGKVIDDIDGQKTTHTEFEKFHCTICEKASCLEDSVYVRVNKEETSYWLRYNKQGEYPEQMKNQGIFLCKSDVCFNILILSIRDFRLE